MTEEFKSAILAHNENWQADLEKVTDLVLKDRPTKPVDVAFFFGRSWFDAEKQGVYQLTVDLYKQGLIKKIAIYGSEGQRFNETGPEMLEPYDHLQINRLNRSVAPPKGFAKARFIKMGIPEEDIILTTLPDPTKNNTIEESKGFLQASKEYRWTSAVVIANQHQLLREILGLIALMDRKSEHMDIYSAAPANPDWQRKVRGAQGEHHAPRKDHVLLEIQRIKTYQEKGDLASFERYFDYLKSRR